MKKMLPIVIVGILVLSGLVGAADPSKSNQTNQTSISTQSKSISFSTPTFGEKDGYLTLNIGGADKQIMETGNPMLPKYVTTFTFSCNANIKDVTCTFSNINEITIDKKILPAPELVILSDDVVAQSSAAKENNEVYGSNTIFPNAWYTYDITVGLNSNQQETIFVTITVYPVRYSPENNKLYYANGADITISYTDPGYTPKKTLESYDMVIIAPQKFSSALQPLITHKNSYGVKTTLMTTESIYSQYSGRDKPEQIKYFIKYAKENWGITYVLLVGGLKSYFNAKDRDDTNQGSKDWYVPVRYENVPLDDDHGCISDLYYGDIYRYNKTSHQIEFEDWDSNGNGIFGEWAGFKNDHMDLNPDVYYGRLPCVNTNELTIVVNKIINYEKTAAGQSWVKTMVAVGGKTFGFYDGQPDGEYLCNLSIINMSSLVNNVIRVYASNNNTGKPVPVSKDILAAISGGAGYVDFEGHGNPRVWSCHWADQSSGHGSWAEGVDCYKFNQLTNGDKLPVVIVGGCHNALFNVTLVQTFRSGNTIIKNVPILKRLITPNNWYWTYGVPLPRCFSWWLVALKNGGAIACSGCTGYGIGYENNPDSLSAELESNFFFQIGQNGSTTLGSAHSGSITKYISDEGVPTDTDAHCICVYQIFGDPSLKLGGY